MPKSPYQFGQIAKSWIRSKFELQGDPIAILDFSERKIRTKTIKMVKVQWNHHLVEEATWEVEDIIRKQYPHQFDQRYPQRFNFSFGLGLSQ